MSEPLVIQFRNQKKYLKSKSIFNRDKYLAAFTHFQ